MHAAFIRHCPLFSTDFWSRDEMIRLLSHQLKGERYAC